MLKALQKPYQKSSTSDPLALTRIQPTVGEYLSHSQSGYYQGRSTTEIVWCHRFLAARVQKFQEEIMITDIDMISAFDAIKRTKLTEFLKPFLREDEIHIITKLHSNTTLDTKSSNNISNPFNTNIGSTHGDGISGCLFIIYLGKALGTLHDRVDNNHVTTNHSYAISSKCTLPDKCIYTDDSDLINYNAENKKRQVQLVTPTFAEFNLQVNDTKTEHTVLKRGEKKTKNCAARKSLVH